MSVCPSETLANIASFALHKETSAQFTITLPPPPVVYVREVVIGYLEIA